jgi:hypothetical protein
VNRLALTLALLALSCGKDNELSGSAGELFSLEVSRVEILRNDEALQVTYFNNRGADLDVVARVSVALKGVELKTGTKIDLAGEYEPGHPRTTVAHAPGGEPVRLMPPVKRGDLVLSAGGNPGQQTRGDFSMVFDSVGGDLGGGRTLVGNFAGPARDAGFGPLP